MVQEQLDGNQSELTYNRRYYRTVKNSDASRYILMNDSYP